MNPIIEVRNIGKKYDIAHMRGGYIALRDVIANVFKNPFSFIAHKARRAVGLEKREEFWALKGVNFNVMPGEVIGVIGANGAGKSTLLKILSQITPPTEGEVILRGRVGSLLEVGTGFHPELTGRENIFLNGAILGMKKQEIARKFDEIVAFAGVDKFLDTPVKYYSSGMYVRLAFSVAAHMDPDILLVDEVLAVGDAEFQKKCLGKMDEITKAEGRTILFVSHNLNAIRQLCTKTLLLQNGRMMFFGDTDTALRKYSEAHGTLVSADLERISNRRGSGKIRLSSFEVQDSAGSKVNSVKSGSNIKLVFGYSCERPEEIGQVDIGFSIYKNDIIISKQYSSNIGISLTGIRHSGRFECLIKDLPLAFGTYTVQARILADGIEADWPRTTIGSFEVTGSEVHENSNYSAERDLLVLLNENWKHRPNK